MPASAGMTKGDAGSMKINSWTVTLAALIIASTFSASADPVKLRVDAPSAYLLKRTAWIERQVRQLGGPAYLAR